MPEPILSLQALTAAVFTSALTYAAGRWARGDRGRWAGWVWCLAVGLATYLGLAILGIRPRWPIREDQHRFLGLVLPGILLFEAVRGSLELPRWLAFGARLAASLAVAPLILHGSSYVAHLAGPGSAEWSLAQRWLIFIGLGLALVCVWSGSAWIQGRSGSAIRVPFALATAITGAGLAVMLSGYASGGLVGLPLAGAIVGAAGAAAFFRGADRDVSPGVGVVGLFCILAIGFFFGRLRADAALILFLCPLLTAIPESPPLLRFGPKVRTVIGLILVACVVAIVTASTYRRFTVDVAGLSGSGIQNVDSKPV